jgi:hypothetical protein
MFLLYSYGQGEHYSEEDPSPDVVDDDDHYTAQRQILPPKTRQ